MVITAIKQIIICFLAVINFLPDNSYIFTKTGAKNLSSILAILPFRYSGIKSKINRKTKIIIKKFITNDKKDQTIFTKANNISIGATNRIYARLKNTCEIIDKTPSAKIGEKSTYPICVNFHRLKILRYGSQSSAKKPTVEPRFTHERKIYAIQK